MRKKISYLAKTYQLLLKTQVKAKRDKSTETALELLTEQVHTIWGQDNNNVAALLSVDIAGAYGVTSKIDPHFKNKENTKMDYQLGKQFLGGLKYNTSHISDCDGVVHSKARYTRRVSSLSHVYLFYSADLLKTCNRPEINTSALGFVDNVNVPVYKKSTEKSCRILEVIHKR